MRSTAAPVAVDPSLLGFATSFTSGSVLLRFPAKNSPAVKFGGKRLTVACAASSASSFGRRALMCMATTSFLMPSPNFAAATDEKSFLQEEIRKVLSKGKAAGLLRLVFHDAGTFDKGDKRGGMNGSIVYELDRPENKDLKKSVKILEKAKRSSGCNTSGILGGFDSCGWRRGCFGMRRSEDPCSIGKSRCNVDLKVCR